MEAASFVGYLSGIMELDKFRELYVQSTDLTLKEPLEDITGKKLPQIEAEWNKYIDTVTIEPGLFHYYGQRALAQRNLAEAVYLYEQGLKVSPDDSTMMVNAYNVYYLAGNYKKAAETIRKMSKFVPETTYYIPLANMLLADSYVDSAMYYYQQARDLDPKNEIPIYKLGQVEYFMGRYNSSREYFQKVLDSAESIPLKIDAHLYLGRIYNHENKADSADEQFTLALNISKNLLAKYPDNPLYNLRAGEAALNLGEVKAGRDFLSVAEYVELRPFYLARILLALGKSYDMDNNRKEAVAYYHRVLDIPSPYMEKADAEKLIKQPFKS
jgi:tetratricopeptide (TPR) repeat protein